MRIINMLFLSRDFLSIMGGDPITLFFLFSNIAFQKCKCYKNILLKNVIYQDIRLGAYPGTELFIMF